MPKSVFLRLSAATLICLLPLPVLAQSSEGLVIPERIELPATVSPPPQPATSKNGDRDSVLNGAVIGAVAFAAWCAYVCGQGMDNDAQHAGAIAMSAGVGGLIGAQIDAGFSRGRRVLFRWNF